VADLTLAVLGTGKLGGALAEGWSAAHLFPPENLQLYNPTRAKAEALAAGLGASAFSNPSEAVAHADVVVLGMKPHFVVPALESIRTALPPEALVISLAAGVRLETMEAALTPGQPVVRAMPTTAARIRQSATAFCRGTHATDDHATTVLRLFDAIGCCVEVTEAQLDGALGVAASGIAFVYLFLEALIDGGVRAGLPREQARTLAIQTLAGAAAMASSTGAHPGVLKDTVTTPGGTTIAGLAVLEQGAVRGAVIGAVDAAARRSRELG
jgi:pyrroline-5-carboxylate reductase